MSKRKAKSIIDEAAKCSKYLSDDFLQLGDVFFDQPCSDLAYFLLGKLLVRKFADDEESFIVGRIVETEAYLGGDDKASHSYQSKKTDRNEPMFMKPGTAYVYFTYGMYHCFNISSQGEGAAVLIRALEPLQGIERMMKLRAEKQKKSFDDLKDKIKLHELCNGPAKLCLSFNVDKSMNKEDMTAVGSELFVADDEFKVEQQNVITAPRIGIGKGAAEWQNKHLRYFIKDNDYVSVKKVIDNKITKYVLVIDEISVYK